MSYLDNLENSLKALESQEERDPARQQREHQRRAEEQDAAARRAPYAVQLKTSPFTGQVLGACRTLGREAGVYVQIAWLEEGLRLQAREHRAELVPTPEGVVAVFTEPGMEPRQVPVDLTGSGEAFVRAWLADLPT